MTIDIYQGKKRLSQNSSLKCSFPRDIWHLKLIISGYLNLSVDLKDIREGTGFTGQKDTQKGEVIEKQRVERYNLGSRMLNSD